MPAFHCTLQALSTTSASSQITASAQDPGILFVMNFRRRDASAQRARAGKSRGERLKSTNKDRGGVGSREGTMTETVSLPPITENKGRRAAHTRALQRAEEWAVEGPRRADGARMGGNKRSAGER